MRLIDLRPTPRQRASPLTVMALGNSDVCYHYRITHDDDHDIAGHPKDVDVVFASEPAAGLPTGLTVEGLLAICEDRAKNQTDGNPANRLVMMQLQAARRALAADRSDKVNHLVITGNDSKRPTRADATASG